MSVREARPEDAATIHLFIKALAQYSGHPDAVEVTPEELESQMRGEHPPFECLLAHHNDEPAGVAIFFPNYSTWRGKIGIYLEDLFVMPEHRGRGLGRALLQRLARIALARNGARLEWSVLNWNEPSQNFYAALGATSLDDTTTWRLTDRELSALASGNLAAGGTDQSSPHPC
jgi:GNAT superfamily N-acetyltransferase